MGRGYGVSGGGAGRERQACQPACSSLSAEKASVSSMPARISQRSGQLIHTTSSVADVATSQGQIDARIQRETRVLYRMYWPFCAYGLFISPSPWAATVLPPLAKHALDLAAIATACVGVAIVYGSVVRHWRRA